MSKQKNRFDKYSDVWFTPEYMTHFKKYGYIYISIQTISSYKIQARDRYAKTTVKYVSKIIMKYIQMKFAMGYITL